MKRAVIYVRVSSEKQGEGVSPDAQEADCRAHCEQKGYIIVEVYRDTEKYRVGTRLVEPSGTRADRPGLKAMLAAARAGHFDVIVAWREDRLYRSYRPMLDVLDTLDEADIDIELVKETFDKRIAPVKAWAAKMELDAKHDRFMMGITGRLERGKPLVSTPAYGYMWQDGEIVANPNEDQYVRKIWQWFSNGETINFIRDQLISQNAPQRSARKYPWIDTVLYTILHNSSYHTGIHEVVWNGKTYQSSIPILVDAETAERVQNRFARYKRHPAGNMRQRALAAGLIYCATCGVALAIDTHHSKSRKYSYYVCRWSFHRGQQQPGCCRGTILHKIDDQLWRKLWTLISEPGRLENAINEHVARLQAQEVVAEADIARIKKALDEITTERQRVITWARKGLISEDDLSHQLLGLDIQVKTLQTELTDAKLLTGNRAERLIELADTFRTQIQAGFEAYKSEPQNEEEAKRQFAYRRELVEAIVERVEVNGDKSIRVHLALDFASELFAEQSMQA